MELFLYDKGLRHERVKLNNLCNYCVKHSFPHLPFLKISFSFEFFSCNSFPCLPTHNVSHFVKVFLFATQIFN